MKKFSTSGLGYSPCSKEYSKDNSYARFDTQSYYCYKETHFKVNSSEKDRLRLLELSLHTLIEACMIKT